MLGNLQWFYSGYGSSRREVAYDYDGGCTYNIYQNDPEQAKDSGMTCYLYSTGGLTKEFKCAGAAKRAAQRLAILRWLRHFERSNVYKPERSFDIGYVEPESDWVRFTAPALTDKRPNYNGVEA